MLPGPRVRVELTVALQRMWCTGLPTGTLKLPPEVKDGALCHRDMDSLGDVVAGLI